MMENMRVLEKSLNNIDVGGWLIGVLADDREFLLTKYENSMSTKYEPLTG